MSVRSTIELLKEPFGEPAYWDRDILSDACKSIPTKPLELKNVMLECGGAPIGLTLCERSQPEYREDLIKSYQVRMRGVLVIKSLHWLSNHGKQVLQQALNKREGCQKLALGYLYDTSSGKARHSHRTIKIWIQAIKYFPATYLFSNIVPDGLMLKTLDRHRWYQVTNIEAETYALSRLYLSRFRMYRVMRDIIDADKEESGIETPSVERTPEWYVQGYLKYQCNSETESQRRLIHDSSDSEIEAGQDGLLAGNKHHKLRHICAAEVRSLLAMHAKWIVKDQREQLHSKKRLINVDLWEAWLRNVDSWREQAARKGLTFGVFQEGDEIQPTPEADSSDADDYTPQAPVSRSSTKRRKLNQPYTLRSTVSLEGQHAYTGRSTRLHPTLTHEPIIAESSSDDLSYDSEFSEHSQASDPPSSDSDDSPPPSPPSPTLLAQIPPELMRPLELPAFGFTWYCPVARCHYKVDLLNPTEENCRGIEAVDVHELKHGKWSMSTPQVQLIFERMVSVHYGDHLSRSGIIVSETGTSITLKLDTTAVQPPTEPIAPARAGGIFKEEDRD